jgi:hypothetical protein
MDGWPAVYTGNIGQIVLRLVEKHKRKVVMCCTSECRAAPKLTVWVFIDLRSPPYKLPK